jgi:TetR/AcrR family tetracycline transcriptional repressor
MARPGPRRTLSPDQLLDAAQELLAERGAGGVSIRGIAARVGVAPNAVYTYFPDKAAVLGALVDGVLGRVDQTRFLDPEMPWRERVIALAVALRDELLADPGIVALMGGVPLHGPNAMAVGETLLEVLSAGGLDAEDAARASYLLTVYVLGAVSLEVAELEQPGPPPPEADRVAARAVGFAMVPVDRYPRSAAVAATMARYITRDQFEWGLERVLDGLAPETASSPRDVAKAGRK